MSQPPPLQAPIAPAYPPPAPRRRRMPTWGWVLLAFGLLVVTAIVALVGWAVSMGWGMFEEQAQAALQADPVVQEQIGQIQRMDIELVATGNAKGANEFVFELEGSRGKGTVKAEFDSTAYSEEIGSGTLTMSDGKRYDIGGASDDEGID